MTCNLETCFVCLFNRHRQQFLIERNLLSVFRPCSFVPACKRHLDQVGTRFDLGSNGLSKFSGLAEVSGESNVCATMGDPSPCRSNIWRMDFARSCLVREP